MLVDKNEQIRALRKKYGRKLNKNEEEIVSEDSEEEQKKKDKA